MKYANDEDLKVLFDALLAYDPGFKEVYRNRTQLRRMKNIERFLNCRNHCRITSFSFELRLCGKVGCVICGNIRQVRCPNVVVHGKNLRDEVLCWADLPVPNPSDPNHFLSPAQTREYIDLEGISFDILKKHLPLANKDEEEKKSVKASKELDKGRCFNASKLRAIIPCDSCGAVRGVYHKSMVGKGTPLERQLSDVLASVENGYICGNGVSDVGGFYVRRQLRCGDWIESAYYNPTAGLRGGRIVTEDICAICFGNDDIVSVEEIKRKRNIGGKRPLLICRHCFESNVEIPCSGGLVSTKEKKDQQKRQRTKQMEAHVERGRKKARRNGRPRSVTPARDF